MKSNVFIAHTPYHILLSSSVALQKNKKENILILFKHFNYR